VFAISEVMALTAVAQVGDASSVVRNEAKSDAVIAAVSFAADQALAPRCTATITTDDAGNPDAGTEDTGAASCNQTPVGEDAGGGYVADRSVPGEDATVVDASAGEDSGAGEDTA
jgi:hypothetical protein